MTYPGKRKSESINFVPDKVEPVCIALDPPGDGEDQPVQQGGEVSGDVSPHSDLSVFPRPAPVSQHTPEAAARVCLPSSSGGD